MEKKDSVVAATDWRAKIRNEERRRVVDHVFTRLKEQLPASSLTTAILNNLSGLAVKFETEMFKKAGSQQEYLVSITRRMRGAEKRLENSSIQNPSAPSSDKSVVQIKNEGVSQPSPQMTNNQPCQQTAAPNLRHEQPAAPNLQHRQLPSASNLLRREQPAAPILRHQQPAAPILRHQQPVAPIPLLQQNIQQLRPQPYEQLRHRQKLTATRAHQQFGVHDQSCVRPQITLNSPYRPLGLQSRDSGIRVSQEMFTPQSKVFNLQPNENLTDQVKKEVIGDDFQASTLSHQHHSVTEEHKQQHQSVGVSADPIEIPNGEECSYRAYLEIQAFKEKYMPLLKEAHEMASKQYQQRVGQTEQMEKLENHLGVMQTMMNFLDLPRNRIVNFTKEKIARHMRSIAQYVKSFENSNKRQPGLSQSHMNPAQRSDNVDPHSQPVNLATTSFPDSSPVAPRQMGSSRPEANRIQKNLLQKMQRSENANQEFQSQWIRQKQKSTVNSQAMNSSGVSSEYHLNSKSSPPLTPATPTPSAEPSCPGTNQQLLTTTQSFNRLLKAVESISDEALRAAVADIRSVEIMNDTIEEPSPFETICHQKAAHLSLEDGCGGGGSSNNMKRKISATTVNDMSTPCSSDSHWSEQSLNQIDSLDSTVASRSKKHKKMTDNALLDEMRNINQQLIETVLEFDSPENVNRRLVNAGTVLRCSYSAITDCKNSNFLSANTQKLPVLSVQLLVPIDYPEDYPVFLGRFTTDSCTEDEESKELSRMAASILRAHLRTTPGRLSLEHIARAWDHCARTVVSDYAQRAGGGCFSSRCGTWEDCMTASF